jgi:predicted amidohydrolase YtcJ
MCSMCDLARAFGDAKATRSGSVSRRAFVAAGLAAGATAAAASAGVVPAALGKGGADVVFVNGKIFTLDAKQPWAQAVGVKGRHIVYVGDTAGAKALIGTRTEVVDLHGKLMTPGFVESHTHPYVGSAFSQGVDLQYDTREQLLEVLATYAKKIGGGSLVRGFGWRYVAFPATGPRKEDLDKIWPDQPVFLVSIDIHGAWVNSKSLELAGITKDSPDPMPGFSYFQRDPVTKEPTGYLVEPPAMIQVLEASEPFTFESVAAGLQKWLPLASAAGITSVFDAGMIVVSEDEGFQHYIELERSGKLPFRVVGTHYYNDPKVDPVPIIANLRSKYRTELVRASVLKLNIDGVLEAYTAAMLEPYSDKADTSGETLLAATLINKIVREADRNGIDVHCHSIGDRATRLTLDAIEAAIKANPPRDRRHSMAHVPLISEQDMSRFRKLGVTVQSSAQWAVLDPNWTDIGQKRWGSRASNTFQFRTILQNGGRVAFGTDWPAAGYYSTYKPLDAIEVAVTRQPLGKRDARILPPADERLDLTQALRANTIDAAYHMHLDDVTGSIEVGKFADLAVLERNLFDLPAHDIHTTPVAMTMMNGRFTHRIAAS